MLLGAFIVLERRLRRGDVARTLVAGTADEGTTRLVGGAFGFAINLGPLLARLRKGTAFPQRRMDRRGHHGGGSWPAGVVGAGAWGALHVNASDRR